MSDTLVMFVLTSSAIGLLIGSIVCSLAGL